MSYIWPLPVKTMNYGSLAILTFAIKRTPPSYWSTALEEFNLSQMILTPTRVNAKSCILIDHIYTNRPDAMCETNVPIISLSDHYPICAPVELITSNVNINTLRYNIERQLMKINSYPIYANKIFIVLNFRWSEWSIIPFLWHFLWSFEWTLESKNKKSKIAI